MKFVFVILAILAIVGVVVVTIVLLNRKTPCCWKEEKQVEKVNKNAQTNGVPKVCSVWDRWYSVSQDKKVDLKHRYGTSWKNVNICPRGSLLQQFNGNSAFCIQPTQRQEITLQLCHDFISNDELATAVPPICAPDEPCAAVDHWVFLQEDLGIESEKRQGSAWNKNVCPSGAAYQMLEDGESWCVYPEHISPKFTT